MNIRQKYRNFLRKLIDTKYFHRFKNVAVLGERLINGYYIVIFEEEICEWEDIEW